jgi:hypothetical protein
MTDGTLVKQFVVSMADMTSQPNVLAAQFAPGAAPAAAELKKYEPYEFEVEGEPRIDGETCTAQVKVMKASGGETAGTVTWSFARADRGWKLREAPLP